MRIEKCVREGNIYVVYIIMYVPTAFTGQEQNGTVWFLSSKWHVPPLTMGALSSATNGPT